MQMAPERVSSGWGCCCHSAVSSAACGQWCSADGGVELVVLVVRGGTAAIERPHSFASAAACGPCRGCSHLLWFHTHCSSNDASSAANSQPAASPILACPALLPDASPPLPPPLSQAASHGFFISLNAVLLKLCGPFMDPSNATFWKRTDVRYVTLPSRISFAGGVARQQGQECSFASAERVVAGACWCTALLQGSCSLTGQCAGTLLLQYAQPWLSGDVVCACQPAACMACCMRVTVQIPACTCPSHRSWHKPSLQARGLVDRMHI